MTAKRHTTINLDMDLVAEAQRILNTSHATETVHRALQEVVDREKRRQLLQMGRGDLTPQSLDRMRQNRWMGEAISIETEELGWNS